jgi:peptide/nickel transport system ATP-binding protein
MTAPLLAVEAIARQYRQRGAAAPLRAVDGVSFALEAGQALGVVGESGSGKSTLARLVMGLERPTAGRVLFEGEPLFRGRRRPPARLRQGFQMVFQDPYGSLDPRMRVGRIIAEPLHLDPAAPRGAARRRLVEAALAEVGLAAGDADRLPHQFSGGQRQRIAIARALIGRPRLLVADEPVSALDLSVQAQVLNLLLELRQRHGLATLFISHNLGAVEAVADRVAVMYRGRFVETGPAAAILAHPAHPYTRLLLDSEPRLDAPRRRLRRPTPSATAAAPVDPGAALASWAHGCAFVARCPHAQPRCREAPPPTISVDTGHDAACHRVGEI